VGADVKEFLSTEIRAIFSGNQADEEPSLKLQIVAICRSKEFVSLQFAIPLSRHAETLDRTRLNLDIESTPE